MSWSVNRGSSSMDLLTLDNMTFSGDPRYHIYYYNITHIIHHLCCTRMSLSFVTPGTPLWSRTRPTGPWSSRTCRPGKLSLLIGKNFFRPLIGPRVIIRDAGKYICTLETFPKQSLMVYLQVNGELLLRLFSRRRKYPSKHWPDNTNIWVKQKISNKTQS